MAQIKNNQVKLGLNPLLQTKTTTPQMRGTVDMNAAMRGTSGGTPFNQSMVPGGQSKIPAPKAKTQGGVGFFPALSALGVTPFQSTKSNSAPQAITASSPAPTPITNTQSQLDSIKSQALGIQDLLDQRKSAEQNKKTQPTNSPTQSPDFFPGVLSQLLGASKPTKEQEKTRKLLEKTALENRAIADEAKRVSDMYGQQIADVGKLGAGAVAGNLSTGTNVVGSGNAAIASQSASQRIQALSQAQQAALKGTEQQLTAQEQTAQAIRPSLEATLTQQQNQLSGLGTAGGLGAPVQVPFTSGLFSPVEAKQLTGQFGNWSDVTTAQQAQDLIAQYADLRVQYNPNLSPQQNLQMVQQAIGGSPIYQRGTFGAAGATSYIGGQQLGAAGTLTGQVAQLQSQGASADANFNLMLDILSRGKINDLNVPIVNQLVQNVSRGLASDADVVAFRSALQTVRSQYASILGGGTPTNETLAMAAEKIPDTVSATALQEVEKTMKAMINNSIAAYNQTINQYSSGQGGGSSGGTITWDNLPI